MRRFTLIALAFVVAGFVAGCEPTITVTNNTKIPVRAVVGSHDRANVLVTAAPGAGATVDASDGTYGVYVVPDLLWVQEAKDIRENLISALADSQNITAPRLMEIMSDLQKISGMIAEVEHSGRAGSQCFGTVNSDTGEGNAQVSSTSTGGLVVVCD